MVIILARLECALSPVCELTKTRGGAAAEAPLGDTVINNSLMLFRIPINTVALASARASVSLHLHLPDYYFI